MAAGRLGVGVRGFVACEESPIERFVLRVLLAECHRGGGFGEFISKVERVSGIEGTGIGVEEFSKERKGVDVVYVEVCADHMKRLGIGQDPHVVVANRLGKLVGKVGIDGRHVFVSQQEQPGVDVFGRRAALCGLEDESPREVAFADTGAGPGDDLSREDRPDAEFLAEPQQEDVDGGGIGVGHFGEVADAHEHLGIGVAAADFEISPETRSEPATDRFEDRVEALRDVFGGEELYRVVERLQILRSIGDDDDGAIPA